MASLLPIQICVVQNDFLINVFSELCAHLIGGRLMSTTCVDQAGTLYKQFVKTWQKVVGK